MKLPEWNHKMQTWDEYEAFHIGINKRGLVKRTVNNTYYEAINFVMFDTGEVICTGNRMTPYDRGYYPSLNVSIHRTIDHDCPTLYTPDGGLIPKRQLNYGGSALILVDCDTKRAVSLHSDYRDKGPVSWPARFRDNYRCFAYFAGDGYEPQGRMPLSVRPPLSKVDKEFAAAVRERELTMRAAMALMDHPATKLIEHSTTYNTGYVHTWTEPKPRMKVPANEIMVDDWQDLPEATLKCFWFAGLDRPRVEYPYLLTEPPK